MLNWMSRAVLVLIVMLAVSLLLFGPVAAFHHDVSYGVLGYMFYGGEDGDPGNVTLFGERYRIYPGRFALSCAIWIVALTMTLLAIRPASRVGEAHRDTDPIP